MQHPEPAPPLLLQPGLQRRRPAKTHGRPLRSLACRGAEVGCPKPGRTPRSLNGRPPIRNDRFGPYAWTVRTARIALSDLSRENRPPRLVVLGNKTNGQPQV